MGLLDGLAYYGEPALGVLSGLAAEPVAGWAGLLGGGGDAVRRTRDALTYQPRTAQGQAGTAALAGLLGDIKRVAVDENPPVRGLLDSYDAASDYVGMHSPLAGAAMRTLPTAASIFAGPATSRAFSGAGVVGDISQAGLRPLSKQYGAIRPDKINRLGEFVNKWDEGWTENPRINDFLEMTPAQRQEVESALRSYWDNPQLSVPQSLSGKMKHAYDSRVGKDGFPSENLLPWLEKAGDDMSRVAVDKNGRPMLVNDFADAKTGKTYEVQMPIRSDITGNVYVDSLIPKTPAPKKKP